MDKEFIDKVCKKFNYDNNLRHAIELCFTLMIDEYKDIEGVKNVLLNVQIFTQQTVNKEIDDKYIDLMMKDYNQNIVFDEGNAYGVSDGIGALYRYFPVFDENMNIIDEKRWIVARDMSDNDGYIKLFGTSLNIPYLLHELGHAYGMQNPIYRVNGNIIYSKHGMYETFDEISKIDGKFIVKTVKQDNIMAEEIDVEMRTQRMLCKYFSCNNDIVIEKLLSIGHKPSAYPKLSLDLAKYMEFALGFENLMRYRKDNDYSVIEKFNLVASESELGKLYFKDEVPFTYLNNNIFEMYKLGLFKSVLGKEKISSRIFPYYYNALAPIYAYNIYSHGKGSIDEYIRARNDECNENQSTMKH